MVVTIAKNREDSTSSDADHAILLILYWSYLMLLILLLGFSSNN